MKSLSEKLKSLLHLSGDPSQVEECVIQWTVNCSLQKTLFNYFAVELEHTVVFYIIKYWRFALVTFTALRDDVVTQVCTTWLLFRDLFAYQSIPPFKNCLPELLSFNLQNAGSDDSYMKYSNRYPLSTEWIIEHMFACLLFQDEELVRKAEETFNDAWTTIKSDGWKVEKQIPEGDIVHSKFLRKNHKIFRITVKIINSFKFFRFDFSKFFFSGYNWNST